MREYPFNVTKKQSPCGIALVTGAARRIGKVTAEGLANSGWAVAIHCNKSVKNAEAVVNKIKNAGGHAALVKADLKVEEEVSNLVEAATSLLGPITCLINNASAFEYDDATVGFAYGYKPSCAIYFSSKDGSASP